MAVYGQPCFGYMEWGPLFLLSEQWGLGLFVFFKEGVYMAKSDNLRKAKKVKNDEFYTRQNPLRDCCRMRRLRGMC